MGVLTELDTESAVYLARDISRLYDCGINEIPKLINSKALPPPLPAGPRGKRRWSRARVNRALGLPIESTVPDVRAVVREEVARAFRELQISPKKGLDW